jgi:hypothetical protein
MPLQQRSDDLVQGRAARITHVIARQPRLESSRTLVLTGKILVFCFVSCETSYVKRPGKAQNSITQLQDVRLTTQMSRA